MLKNASTTGGPRAPRATADPLLQHGLHDAASGSWDSLFTADDRKPSRAPGALLATSTPNAAATRPSGTLPPRSVRSPPRHHRDPRASDPWTSSATITNPDPTTHTPSGEPAMDRALLTPELGYKLSKKIAQLTKVIYAVHLRNDHHHAEMCSVVEAYEAHILAAEAAAREAARTAAEAREVEIQEVRREADAQVAAERAAREAEVTRVAAEAQASVDQVKREKEEEAARFRKQVLDLELRLEVAEANLKDERTKAVELGVQLEETARGKIELEEQAELLKAARDEDAKRHAAELAHQAALATAESSHRAALDAANKDTLRRVQDLHLARDQLASLEASLRTQSESWSHRERELETLVSRLETKLTAMHGDHSAQGDQLRALLDAATAEAKQSAERVCELTRELESARDTYAVTERERADAVEQVGKLRAQLAGAESRHASVVRERDALAQKLKETTEEAKLAAAAAAEQLRSAKERSDQSTAAFAQERARLEQACRMQAAEAKDLASKLLALEHELMTERSTGESKSTELAAQVADLQSRLDTAMTERDRALASAEGSAAQLQDELDDWRRRFAALDAQLQNAVNDHDDRVRELERMHREAQKRWAAERAAERSDMARDHAAAVERMKLKWDEEMRTVVETRAAAVRELKARVGAEVEHRAREEARVVEAGRELGKMQEQLTAARNECEVLRLQVAAVSGSLQSAEASAQQAQSAHERLKNELQDAKNQLAQSQRRESELAGTVAQLDAQLADERNHLATKDSELTKLATINNTITEQQSRIAQLTAELDARSKEVQRAASTIEQNVKSIKDLKDLTQRLLTSETTLQAELERARTDHAVALAAVHSEHEQQIETMSTAFLDEKAALHDQLRVANQRIEDQIATLERARAEALADQTAAARRQAELMRDLERARAQAVQQREASEAKIAALETQFRSDTEAAATRHAQDVENAKREHLARTQAMLGEFESAQAFMKSEVERLTRALEAAEVKYINREPRQEDLDRVHRCEIEIDRHKRTIVQLTEDIARIRLEVQSREDSIHRHFGSRPNVGVLMPGAGAASKKGAAGSRTTAPSLLHSRSSAAILPPLGKSGILLSPNFWAPTETERFAFLMEFNVPFDLVMLAMRFCRTNLYEQQRILTHPAALDHLAKIAGGPEVRIPMDLELNSPNPTWFFHGGSCWTVRVVLCENGDLQLFITRVRSSTFLSQPIAPGTLYDPRTYVPAKVYLVSYVPALLHSSSSTTSPNSPSSQVLITATYCHSYANPHLFIDGHEHGVFFKGFGSVPIVNGKRTMRFMLGLRLM
ncbi:hypothetical protein H9P43_000216 [Blastocladiella emersonii ATCC 22665]|nr:hypothetical protein H9P43_000216 [Blastocladiella emersonii ATCC 22665]